MANEQSLNGNTHTISDTSQNLSGEETPLHRGLLCSQQILSRSRAQKNKRYRANRKAKTKADIVLDNHPAVVTSVENHPSVTDSESAPLEIDRDTSTEAGVRLEICLPPEKKQKREQKEGEVSLRSDSIDGRCTKDTSVDVVPVKLHSDLSREKAGEHSGPRVVEELDSKKHLDACSVGKHQGDSMSNESSFNLGNIQIYQRGRSSDSTLNATAFPKEDNMSSIPALLPGSLRGDTSVSECMNQVTYYRRRKKCSGSNLSSPESLSASASPVEMSMQNCPAGDSPMDNLEQAVNSGLPENIMGEVDATHDTSLLVAGDIVMGEACGECPDNISVSKEEEKTKEIEDLGGLPEKSSILNNSSTLERIFVLDKSNEAENISLLDKNINVEKNSVLITGNKEVIKNTAKQEILQKPATSDHNDYALDLPSLTQASIGHIESGGMGIPSSLENTVAYSSLLSTTEDSTGLADNTMGSPQRALNISAPLSRKKLLVLDVNGILADIVLYGSEQRKPDIIVSGKAVFKRPFCDDFLQFCFERFNVGVWSSRTKRNVEAVINFLMRKSKDNLLFCWDQSHCTETGFNTVENREKPLVLKELRYLWEKNRQGLPWKRGEYNESNTLLLDDSPYKALRNPPHTAIFPHPYSYLDVKDNCLGPGGDLRLYLEGLAAADDVQNYVKLNPFGQRPITERNASWRFYLKIIGTKTSKEEKVNNDCACVSEELATETVLSTNPPPMDNA